jgi:hypothetical protein
MPRVQCRSVVATAGRCGVALLFTTALLLATTMTLQAETTFVSGSSQVHLIELYTSEGCSSCPPADRWLGSLQSNPQLWSRVVPVAFHVDYWDYLGWKDDYASDQFSERQRRYARLRQVSQVYTPGMLLDGREWRDWVQSNALAQPALGAAAQVGQLTLKYDRAHSVVSFAPTGTLEKLPGKAHLALLGVAIESPIKSGENQGKRLRHDFVVLELVSAALKRGESGFVATLPAITTALEAPRYAVAAWVTDQSDSKPLQALGGWLP